MAPLLVRLSMPLYTQDPLEGENDELDAVCYYANDKVNLSRREEPTGSLSA